MPNKSCGNCAYRSGDTDIIYCQNKMHFGIAMKHDMVCDSWEPEKKGLQSREKLIRGGAFSGDIHSPKNRGKTCDHGYASGCDCIVEKEKDDE